MIMRNTSENAMNSTQPSRTFTKILKEAQKHWTELEYDPKAKMARGALYDNERLIIAVLSFDESRGRLTLTARLPLVKELNMPIMRRVLRYQNNHRQFSGSLAIDEECHIASVWANAVVYTKIPSKAVDSVFKDTNMLLKDAELNDLLN